MAKTNHRADGWVGDQSLSLLKCERPPVFTRSQAPTGNFQSNLQLTSSAIAAMSRPDELSLLPVRILVCFLRLRESRFSSPKRDPASPQAKHPRMRCVHCSLITEKSVQGKNRLSESRSSDQPKLRAPRLSVMFCACA